MKLDEFDFFLPENLIAQVPEAAREMSRLLFIDRQKKSFAHKSFIDLLDIFANNDVLVLNKSKVIPARLLLEGNREILLNEHLGEHVWKCLVRPGKKFQSGTTLHFADGSSVRVVSIEDGGLRKMQFFPVNGDFWKFLENCGQIPLPPYIKREPKKEDAVRYQTVYAATRGSVAAPTAGLHFTEAILQKLKKKGVQIEFITLHVGAGTFLPVKTQNISQHLMHTEIYEIDTATAERINSAITMGKTVTAVGSTSLRALESSARDSGKVQPGMNKTALFLYPPAKFQTVDHLLTNFHLPKSTLLMLVAAFASPGQADGIAFVQEIYAEAIREEYRFFSYGDATLWW